MKKEKQIKKIQNLLDELGTKDITIYELNTESSIVVGELANGKVMELIETINYEDVSTAVYLSGDDNEITYSDVNYENLSLETLTEIVEALQYYKIDMDKTMDIIRDEDF